MSFWFKDGNVLVDGSGNPMDCPDCPCGGVITDGCCDTLPTTLYLQFCSSTVEGRPNLSPSGCEVVEGVWTLTYQGGGLWSGSRVIVGCTNLVGTTLDTEITFNFRVLGETFPSTLGVCFDCYELTSTTDDPDSVGGGLHEGLDVSDCCVCDPAALYFLGGMAACGCDEFSASTAFTAVNFVRVTATDPTGSPCFVQAPCCECTELPSELEITFASEDCACFDALTITLNSFVTDQSTGDRILYWRGTETCGAFDIQVTLFCIDEGSGYVWRLEIFCEETEVMDDADQIISVTCDPFFASGTISLLGGEIGEGGSNQCCTGDGPFSVDYIIAPA